MKIFQKCQTGVGKWQKRQNVNICLVSFKISLILTFFEVASYSHSDLRFLIKNKDTLNKFVTGVKQKKNLQKNFLRRRG